MAESSEQNLVAVYQRLSETERETLLAFAEFLAQRGGQVTRVLSADRPSIPEVKKPPEKLDIPRPEEERVIAAVKRLAKTFPDLDKNKMLNETSGLMTAHIIQGKDPREVIDELEAIFLREFELMLSGTLED